LSAADADGPNPAPSSGETTAVAVQNPYQHFTATRRSNLWTARHYSLDFGTFNAMPFNNTKLFGRSPISAIAEQVVRSGLSFARSGDPNNPAIPMWAPYTSNHRAEMFFDYDCRVEHDAWREERGVDRHSLNTRSQATSTSGVVADQTKFLCEF
jgi:hypothetical protein